MEILKHDSLVDVLEPDWLRKKIIKEMNSAVKKYRG